jgi:uncharacterized membrane protein
MRTIIEFMKTTLVGGLLVLLPIYVSILLLLKTLAGVTALLAPLTAKIPATVQFRQVVAILVFFAACFVAGLIVRTGPGRRGVSSLDHYVLAKIPGYSLLRGLATRVGGEAGDDDSFAPALVEIEDALVPAMIIEELPDGRFTVMVPSVPTPVAGAIYVLPPERVHRVNVPLRQLLHVYSKWGEGTGALVAAARRT